METKTARSVAKEILQMFACTVKETLFLLTTDNWDNRGS